MAKVATILILSHPVLYVLQGCPCLVEFAWCHTCFLWLWIWGLEGRSLSKWGCLIRPQYIRTVQIFFSVTMGIQSWFHQTLWNLWFCNFRNWLPIAATAKWRIIYYPKNVTFSCTVRSHQSDWKLCMSMQGYSYRETHQLMPCRKYMRFHNFSVTKMIFDFNQISYEL